MRALILCDCGCGALEHPNRMVFVRRTWQLDGRTRPGRDSWQVRRECQQAFESELITIHALQLTVEQHAGAGWLRRLLLAPQLYDMQKAIHLRRKGEVAAIRLARRTSLMWLLPRWLAMRIGEPKNQPDLQAEPAGPEGNPTEAEKETTHATDLHQIRMQRRPGGDHPAE